MRGREATDALRKLGELLSRLSATQGVSTQLRIISDDADAAMGSRVTWSDAQRLSELRSIKSQLDQIRSKDGGTQLFLPVFVEAPDLTSD